jgi:hypothetical protein
MAKTKNPIVELTPVEKVHAAFMEDFNDTELQERFDNFERTLKSLKDRYNELVPNLNDALKDQSTLNQMILDSAKMSFINTDAIKRLKVVEAYLDENMKIADDLKNKMAYEQDLITKYKWNSNDRLFQWWKTIKTIEPDTKPWLEWKTQYDSKII